MDKITSWEADGHTCVTRMRKNLWPCGYVLVTSDSKLYGLNTDTLDKHLDPYGGVTYAGPAHKVLGDTVANEWAIGFDMGHACDCVYDTPDALVPTWIRTEDDCKREVNTLLEQIVEFEKEHPGHTLGDNLDYGNSSSTRTEASRAPEPKPEVSPYVEREPITETYTFDETVEAESDFECGW